MVIETVIRFIAFICLITQQVTCALFKTINGRLNEKYYEDNARIPKSNLESCFEYFCSGKTNCVVLRNDDTGLCFKALYSAQVLEWISDDYLWDMEESYLYYKKKPAVYVTKDEDKKWNIAYSSNNSLTAKKPEYIWLLDEVSKFGNYGKLWYDNWLHGKTCEKFLKFRKHATGPRPGVPILYAEPYRLGLEYTGRVKCLTKLSYSADGFDFEKPFTFAMWIKAKSVNRSMHLIESLPPRMAWTLNSTHGIQNSYCIYVIRHRYLDCATTVINNVKVNEWHHIAVVKKDLSDIKFFLDGYEMELLTKIKNPEPYELDAFKNIGLREGSDGRLHYRTMGLWVFYDKDSDYFNTLFEGVGACLTGFQGSLSESEIRYLRGVCP